METTGDRKIIVRAVHGNSVAGRRSRRRCPIADLRFVTPLGDLRWLGDTTFVKPGKYLVLFDSRK